MERPVPIIHRPLGEVGPALGEVIREIGLITLNTFTDDRLVIHCLQAPRSANAAGRTHLIVEKKELDHYDPADQFLLRTKVGKIEDEELYAVRREIANMDPAASIEDFSGTSLYVFLNKRLIQKPRRPKPGRWTGIGIR